MPTLFAERSLELERMDVEALAPDDAKTILGALETINYLLGGVRATLSHFKRWSVHWKPGAEIRVVDWGTGGADIPRALVRWARQQGYRLTVTGVDENPAAIAYAKEASRDFPEITLVECDAASFSPIQPFDYAVSSLVLHHLSDTEIVNLLKRSDQIVSRGIVMNDLIRSARAWAWIWFLSRAGRAHPMVRHDGPLSVRRAFHPAELLKAAQSAQLSYLKVRKHFGYRLTLAGEKS